VSKENRQFVIHDGMIGFLTKRGTWAQLFLKNIHAYVNLNQEEGGKRIDVRDLDLDHALYLIVFDDDLNPLKAYRLEETSLKNRNLKKVI